MQRILLLTSHPLEGRDGADKQLATSVARGVIGVQFIWFSRAPAVSEPALERGRRVRVLSRKGVPGPSERLQIALRATCLEPRTDLVHVIMTIGPGFARYASFRSRLPMKLRRPVIHTVPGIARPEMLVGARPLGRTVALSQISAERLHAAGFGEVSVIPPGVELDRWPAVRRSRDEVPTVLFAGHHDPGGGAREAVRAVAEAQHLSQRLRMVFAMRPRIGQDERSENDRLRAFAASHGVVDTVFHGRVDDLPALVRAADVLLFPPLHLHGKADVPLTVLEAMATRRPVVVSDHPEFDALGDAVLRAPVGDVTALGRHVVDLLRSPGRWDEQAGKGRRLVEERFSDRSMAQAYARLYEESLGAPH
jgi:glycosyltransferase involved in cell wall biosynthesis